MKESQMSTKMNRDQLLNTAKEITVQAGNAMTKADLDVALNALVGAIKSGLAHGMSVPLPEIGTLKVSPRAASTGRNPKTGEEVDVPACAVVRFTTGKALKDALVAEKTIEKLL